MDGRTVGHRRITIDFVVDSKRGRESAEIPARDLPLLFEILISWLVNILGLGRFSSQLYASIRLLGDPNTSGREQV